MKINTLFFSLLLFMSNVLCAQDQTTESPYFFVDNELPENFNPQSFALINSKVDVSIAGMIAEVSVEQRYRNESDLPLDTRYVFPGSTQSAIYAMEMEVNGAIIQATIKEKQEAKEIFETAKEAGKSATLLEQHRPNVFELSVANIKAKSDIVVRFKYTEVLIPTNKTYEFVFPTLVGPRYATAEMASKDPWVANPYTNPESAERTFAEPTFSMNVKLNAGMKINQAFWLSHPNTSIQYESENELSSMIPENAAKNNGDYIFRYQLSGEKIASGLLLFEGEEENFFLYTIQPPARPVAKSTPPRDYIFIVDVSGSMNGFPIEVSKKLMRSLLSGLNAEDRFNVLLFAGSSDVYSSDLVSANSNEINKAIRFIEEQNGSGGTEILPALKRALDMIDDNGRSTTVVIATDGLVTVEREAIALMEDNLGKANFFPFGIGSSSNRYIIEAMAHAGMSEPFICTTEAEALKKAKEFQQLILNPVLTDIQVSFDGMKVYDVIPKNSPDLFADKSLVLFGKYKSINNASITVRGKNADGKFNETMDVSGTNPSNENQALRYLWARQKIKMLADYNRAEPDGELKEEITDLGLKYSLLTEFTSFVAVDERPEQVVERMKNTQQSSSSSSGSVPEPHEWSLIIVGLLVLAFLLISRFGFLSK